MSAKSIPVIASIFTHEPYKRAWERLQQLRKEVQDREKIIQGIDTLRAEARDKAKKTADRIIAGEDVETALAQARDNSELVESKARQELMALRRTVEELERIVHHELNVASQKARQDLAPFVRQASQEVLATLRNMAIGNGVMGSLRRAFHDAGYSGDFSNSYLEIGTIGSFEDEWSNANIILKHAVEVLGLE